MAQTSADAICYPDSTVSTSNSSAASDTVHEGDPLFDSDARSLLLQQALFQAAAVRAQQQAVKASANNCPGIDPKSTLFPQNPLGFAFNGAVGHDAAEEAKQKTAIQSHPLFPVLEALLLKCEDATWNMSDKSVDLDDIVQILKRLEAGGKPVRTGDDELDRLVLDSILVLRMNLVELAKVADLCDDFRTRYVQCIKRKMNQETLLGFGNESDDESLNGDGRCSPGSSNRARGAVAMLTTAQGTVSVALERYGSTDGPRPDQERANDALNANYPTNGHFSFDDDAFNFEHRGPGRKSSLPKKAVDVLKAWLFQHVTHPYPTELEKAQLSHDTNLSLIQVNNWFINARRRILQPMLEGPCNEWSQSVTLPKNKKQRLSSTSSPEALSSPLPSDVQSTAAEATREPTRSNPDSPSSSATPTP